MSIFPQDLSVTPFEVPDATRFSMREFDRLLDACSSQAQFIFLVETIGRRPQVLAALIDDMLRLGDRELVQRLNPRHHSLGSLQFALGKGPVGEVKMNHRPWPETLAGREDFHRHTALPVELSPGLAAGPVAVVVAGSYSEATARLHALIPYSMATMLGLHTEGHKQTSSATTGKRTNNDARLADFIDRHFGYKVPFANDDADLNGRRIVEVVAGRPIRVRGQQDEEHPREPLQESMVPMGFALVEPLGLVHHATASSWVAVGRTYTHRVTSHPTPTVSLFGSFTTAQDGDDAQAVIFAQPGERDITPTATVPLSAGETRRYLDEVRRVVLAPEIQAVHAQSGFPLDLLARERISGSGHRRLPIGRSLAKAGDVELAILLVMCRLSSVAMGRFSMMVILFSYNDDPVKCFKDASEQIGGLLGFIEKEAERNPQDEVARAVQTVAKAFNESMDVFGREIIGAVSRWVAQGGLNRRSHVDEIRLRWIYHSECAEAEFAKWFDEVAPDSPVDRIECVRRGLGKLSFDRPPTYAPALCALLDMMKMDCLPEIAESILADLKESNGRSVRGGLDFSYLLEGLMGPEGEVMGPGLSVEASESVPPIKHFAGLLGTREQALKSFETGL